MNHQHLLPLRVERDYVREPKHQRCGAEPTCWCFACAAYQRATPTGAKDHEL